MSTDMNELFARAREHEKHSEHKKAHEIYREIVELFPENAEAHKMLGISCGDKMWDGKPLDPARGITHLLNALEIDPDDRDTLLWLAIFHRALGQYAEALSYGHMALDRDPIHAPTYVEIALTLQERAAAAATEVQQFFDHVRGMEPENPYLFVYLGQALQATGQPRQAIDAWERAVSLDPGLADAWKLLGTAYFNLGEDEKSEHANQVFSRLWFPSNEDE